MTHVHAVQPHDVTSSAAFNGVHTPTHDISNTHYLRDCQQLPPTDVNIDMAATPANIDVQAPETQTPVSMTLGNDEALLHTHLILSLLPFKLLSCMQILKKQGGRNRGCIMHKIEGQY